MKSEKEFVTSDLYLASFLSLHLKHFPDFKVRSGKTFFVFPECQSLYDSINAYNSGCPWNAFDFAQQIRRLRGEMLARRGQGVMK